MTSLLTNVTLAPTAVMISTGLTPFEVIVTTRGEAGAGTGAAVLPEGGGDGVDGAS